MIHIDIQCETVEEAIEKVKKIQKAGIGELSVTVKIINLSDYEP